MRKSLLITIALVLLAAVLPAALAENALAFEPYEETVVINVMADNRTATWYPEGEDVTHNVLLDYYRERLNMDIQSPWITDDSNYSTQIDLMIAADNLPDLFYATPEQLYRLVQAGQIQPIGDIYDQYASDALKKEIGDSTSTYFAQGTVDGQVYGFPFTKDYSDQIPIVYIRKDWLDKVGMETPTTWEDYEAMMQAFMDQCGAKYGMAVPIGHNSKKSCAWDVFLSPYKAHYGAWETAEDGSLVYSNITENARQGLLKMHEWYEAGYLSPEFSMANVSINRDDINNGYVGAVVYSYYPSGSLGEFYKSNPDIEWVSAPIPMCEDGTYSVEGTVTAGSYVVVRAGYEHPEALIKYMNLWEDMWRGESGEYYHGLNQTTYAQAEENFKYYVPFWFDPPTKNMYHARIAWENLPDGDVSAYAGDYEFMKQWNAILDVVRDGNVNVNGYLHLICYAGAFYIESEVYDCVENGFITAFTGPLSEDYANYKAIADSSMEEYFVAAVMGAKNLDDDWNTFVKTWNASGGQYMTDYVNEWNQSK